MKIYTKTGDKGQTSVIGGRVDKDDIRVEAYGTLDEANSFIGQAMAELNAEIFADVLADLEKIQHELFDCGGELATVGKRGEPRITADVIQYIEEKIDQLMAEAPPIERFILPGGTKPAATIHIARTVVRRAERLLVSLLKVDTTIPINNLHYINRLSDYLFALARVVNHRMGVKDVEYIRSGKVFR